MHSYLRAVGFSDMDKKTMKKLVESILENHDEKIIVNEEKNRVFAEISKSFSCDCGIKICGEYDENDEFQLEYYFPYFKGTHISTKEDVLVEQRSEKECFSGACDDVRIGVTIIFYLCNAGEYLKEVYKEGCSHHSTSLSLSGLSTEGKVLFPIHKNMEQVRRDRQTTAKRSQLINEARKGNEEAMESLTMEDMDTYSMISRRIQTEDILTIVDSFFIPYGMECDRYHILGEIVDMEKVRNSLTHEEMYQMTVFCNEMEIDVCINQNDLMGVPEIGRRFKGVVWLQGCLNF